MSMIYNFDKEFVERTKDVLKNVNKHTEFEVTLLLNCLLALVTLPLERNKVTKTNRQLTKFQEQCINKLYELKNNYKNEIFNKDDNYTFNHIRNSIAHLHIELEESNYKNQIQNIILRDAYDKEQFESKNYNFAVSVSVNNLKEFAIYVADEYIKEFF